MDAKDALTLELYRQSWETSRHRFMVFLNLISVFAVLFGAGLIFMTQSEKTSDNLAAGIVAFLAVQSFIGLVVWVQVGRSTAHLAEVQLQIHDNTSTQFTKSLGDPYRTDRRFFWFGVVVLVILTFGLLASSTLLLIDAVSLFDPTDEPTSEIQATRFTPSQKSTPPWYETGCLTTYPQAFCDAMKDAETAEPSEIWTELTAITAQNDALKWSDVPGRSRVLTVTWTDWDGYDSTVGADMTTTRDIWVTIAPQAQEFCRNYQGGENLVLRMEQLIGLAPDSRKTKFVELWAFPEDMFRPSPDPEITDHEAELDFPVSSQFVTVTAEHVNWINTLRGKSYEEGGLPWTRLGYTYDWGDPNSDIGLSEFVIRAGTSVGVRSVTSNEDYC